MSQKSIYITGASTGLGKAVALMFAERGYRVFATMRKPEQGAEIASHANITVSALDVTNPEQIKSSAAEAIKQAGTSGIDLVFANAGYGLVGPLEGTSDAEIVREIDTNLLGVIRTTQAFIEHFRSKRSGMFIATTSIGGLAAFPFNSLYHATKWGIEGFYESLAYELSKFGIVAKTVSPGGIQTDFASRSLVLQQHKAYDELVGKVLSVFGDPARQATRSTAEQIAQVVYEAATDGKDQLRYTAGNDAKEILAQRNQVGVEIFRKGVDARFFGK